MEGRNGHTLAAKPMENGVKGKPLYSVETPYGFQLDLDFLKYVDDIEKGNTIKRVPIHRRSKGPRASTLPRHLHATGSGYRPSPWGSTGALGLKSRMSDSHHYGGTFWARDQRSSLSPTGLKTLTEMEARIKEFDEQPLGEHIRPHLLRASSLPLTVLLRQGSEYAEDTGSSADSRDGLGERIISCEDIFYTSAGHRSQECSGLLGRLRDALERVSELEVETRLIPELRAQIHVLQEERERLRLGLNPRIPNGNTDLQSSAQYSMSDIKRPRHESRATSPRACNDSNPSQGWRTSTDLDELLTVTSLQAKVAALEQKLHETDQELQRALALLSQRQEESREKDGKIHYLVSNPGVWVRAERVMVEQDGDDTAVRSNEPQTLRTLDVQMEATDGQEGPGPDATSSSLTSGGHKAAADVDSTTVVHHISRIRRLLEQQWECLCAGQENEPPSHPNPKVNDLQREMMGLVDTLSSFYSQQEHSGGGSDAEMEHDEDGRVSISTRADVAGVNEGQDENASGQQHCAKQSEEKESSVCPRDVAAAQVKRDPERRRSEEGREKSLGGQMISGGAISVRTDGAAASAEAERTAKMKRHPGGGQTESSSGSSTATGGSEEVNSDFMAACQFLQDHMDNMENPSDEMREALVVVFQRWFSVAAEEASVASELSVYLRAVRRSTPSLLAFLVNLADDNDNTVLHYSVSHCNYSVVSLLLETGVCDVNLENSDGYTAVMLASLTAPDGPDGMEVVRRLMELGNIHIRSKQTGQTALHLAVRHGRVVMVRLLLSYGADANIQDSQGTTALMFAAERGHTHVARLLLERSQCDLTLTDKRGRTALSIATQFSHSDTAALLHAHAKARAL